MGYGRSWADGMMTTINTFIKEKLLISDLTFFFINGEKRVDVNNNHNQHFPKKYNSMSIKYIVSKIETVDIVDTCPPSPVLG